MREIFLQPGQEVTIVAGGQLPVRPLITEEERQAQLAKRRALGKARDAARQLALPLQLLQGGDPDEKSKFTMDAPKRIQAIAAELKRTGVNRDELFESIRRTYLQAKHRPSDDEAFDLAQGFVNSLPGFAEDEVGSPESPNQ